MVSEPQTRVIDVFEKVTLRHGGRFDLSLLPTVESDILHSLKLIPFNLDPHTKLLDIRPNAPRCDRLYIDYVSNWDANAVAIREPPLYFVGVWIGLPLAILNFYLVLLRNPAIFADVGAPHPDWLLHRFPPAAFWSQLDNLGPHRWPKGSKVRFFDVLPRDEERKKLAVSLFVTALGFVRSHEFSHIFHGHLDFCHAKNGTQLLPEYHAKPLKVISAEDRQALELFADTFATTFTVEEVFDAANSAEKQNSLPRCALSHRGLSRFLSFVFGTIFFLLSHFERPRPASPASSHPNERMRTRNAINWTGDCLERRGLPASEVKAGQRDAIVELNHFSKMIGVKHPAFADESEREMVQREAQIYGKLIDRYHCLKSELDSD